MNSDDRKEMETLRARVDEHQARLTSQENIHAKDGPCACEIRRLWQAVNCVPTWAKVGLAVIIFFTGIFGFLISWMFMAQVDVGVRLPVVETRQADVRVKLDKIELHLEKIDTKLTDNGEKMSQILLIHKKETQ